MDYSCEELCGKSKQKNGLNPNPENGEGNTYQRKEWSWGCDNCGTYAALSEFFKQCPGCQHFRCPSCPTETFRVLESAVSKPRNISPSTNIQTFGNQCTPSLELPPTSMRQQSPSSPRIIAYVQYIPEDFGTKRLTCTTSRNIPSLIDTTPHQVNRNISTHEPVILGKRSLATDIQEDRPIKARKANITSTDEISLQRRPRKFACPFYKNNPDIYGLWTDRKYKSCPGPSLKEFRRIK
jgi:hypothetical protein